MHDESSELRVDETRLQLVSQKRSHTPSARRSSRRAGSRRLAGVPALIVDDDPPNARLISRLLADEGCDVRVAGTAEEALLLLGTFSPQLIVLELVLPRMSGLLFVQRLKAEPTTRDIVVIAVSALNGPHVERLATESGCVAYIPKPIDRQTFGRTVASHVRGTA
jgi:CheY-like chemotaxis protein